LPAIRGAFVCCAPRIFVFNGEQTDYEGEDEDEDDEMNDYKAHGARIRMMQARLGKDCPMVSWNDKEWRVIPGSALRKSELGAGGYSLDADFVFEALVETFVGTEGITDAKSLKDALLRTPIGYLDDEYQVATVRIRPGGFQVMMECTALNQRA